MSASTMPDAVRCLGDDRAPRVDDHRAPEGRLAGRPADLRRGEDPGAVLDGPRAEQDLPVVAAGPLREVGRDRQDLGAGQGERPVQLREAQVVADRQTEPDAVDVGARPASSPAVTRADSVSAGPALDGDVEQVDLAVAGGDLAVRARCRTLVLYGRSGSSAVSATLPTRIQRRVRRATSANGVGERAGDRPGAGAEAVVAAAVLEVLRQRDEPGAAGRRPRRRARRRGRGWRRRRRSRRAGRGRRSSRMARIVARGQRIPVS